MQWPFEYLRIKYEIVAYIRDLYIYNDTFTFPVRFD